MNCPPKVPAVPAKSSPDIREKLSPSWGAPCRTWDEGFPGPPVPAERRAARPFPFLGASGWAGAADEGES